MADTDPDAMSEFATPAAIHTTTTSASSALSPTLDDIGDFASPVIASPPNPAMPMGCAVFLDPVAAPAQPRSRFSIGELK